jgi:hypothetical protein
LVKLVLGVRNVVLPVLLGTSVAPTVCSDDIDVSDAVDWVSSAGCSLGATVVPQVDVKTEVGPV